MNSLMLVALCALTFGCGCVVAEDNAFVEILPSFTECAKQFAITQDVIDDLHIKGFDNLVPSENFKCFYRCIHYASDLMDGNQLNWERIKQINLRFSQKDEATILANIATCKAVYHGADTCDEAWDLAKCFASLSQE